MPRLACTVEAVHVLATTKSTRAGSDRELVNWLARGEPTAFARIAASVGRGDSEIHVDLLLRGYLPAGLFVDDEDRIYIADQGNARVQVFQRVSADVRPK